MRMNLTWAQVGGILKYTRPAWWRGETPETHHYLMKKPGYYLSEEAYIARLRKELNLALSLKDIKALGGDALPVCIAKTQYSLSDDPTLLGRPTGFNITIRDLRLSNGAGFVVAYAGDVMTMPGLPKVPSAEKIDVDGNGVIHGLF